MVKMEIELTDEQLKKVEILKSQNVSVGEAIDLLFGLQGEILTQIEEHEGDENILEKLQDTGFDLNIKQELLRKEYGEAETKTYDKSVQDAKRKVKWSSLF